MTRQGRCTKLFISTKTVQANTTISKGLDVRGKTASSTMLTLCLEKKEVGGRIRCEGTGKTTIKPSKNERSSKQNASYRFWRETSVFGPSIFHHILVLFFRDVRYHRFSMLPTGNNRKSDFDVTYR